MLNFVCLTKKNVESIRLVKIPFVSHQIWAQKTFWDAATETDTCKRRGGHERGWGLGHKGGWGLVIRAAVSEAGTGCGAGRADWKSPAILDIRLLIFSRINTTRINMWRCCYITRAVCLVTQ